ncbi:MAG: SpoIVB peptidase S55 domain-containing protein [Armatimonadota bacterium]
MNCRFGQRRRLVSRSVSLLLPVSGLVLTPTVAAPPANNPPARLVPGKPGVYRLDPKVYLPTSQLRPGMRGYGLTVFRGDKIERFDVNILGVLRKINNGRDLILVKVGGNNNLNRVSDIIAGMSGSPVYVNGKIVGAVAYGSSFTKERIGYLTPIEDMLDAWDPALPQYPDGFAPRDRSPSEPSTRLAEPVTINGESFTQVRHLGFGESAPAKPGTLMLRPLGMPVSVSGVPARRWAQVAEELGKLGLEARQGVGGGAASLAAPGPKLTASPLQPGGAVAMSLATGDIDITGVGTLTFRADRRIVAFGHPFLSIGPIDAPMSTVHIFDILPSYNTSSKIGVAVTQVGAFSQDRPFSIAGNIGAKPAMVPVQVRINDRSVGRSRVFKANIVRHPALTRQLAMMATGTAIAEVHSQPGDTMATVRTTVTADEVGTITRTNRVYSPSAIDQAATDDLASLVSLLSGNPFYPLPIRSVSMEVDIESGRKTAQIERVFVSQTRYEPGETIDVNVVLRPYMKERVVKTIPVRIPTSVPNNSVLAISIQGGGASGGGLSLGLGSDGGLVLTRGGGDFSSAVNIRQVVRRYLEKDRNDALVARLLLPSSAVSVQGEKLSGLPPNIEQALRGGTGTAGSRSSGARLERDEVKESVLTDYILSGSQSISIRVARRGTPDTSAPTLPSAPPAPSSDSGITSPIPAAPPPTGALPDIDIDADAAMDPFAPASAVSVFPADVKSPAGQSTTPPGAAVGSVTVKTGQGETITVPSSAPAPAAAAKPVGRLPGVWRQATATDFRAATSLDGVTVSSSGEVRLAPKLTRVSRSVVDPYYWALAPAPENGVYVGSGDNGVIYRVGVDGKQSVFARTGTLEVHSLLTGADGTVYAGTSPDGLLMRIAPNSAGKPARLMKAEEKYVLALALSPDGKTVYAGTGGPKARVYRVASDGTGAPEVVYESAEGSVTALTVASDGTVYAGTAPNGLVVKVAGPKISRPLPLYDAAESAVTGLTTGSDGTVYAATMMTGRGVLYRIDPATGASAVLYDRAPGGVLTGLQRSGKDGTLYTASGGTLIAVDPTNGDARTFEAPSGADVQILAVLASDSDDRVWASTGNTAEVYRLAVSGEADTASGQMVSRVFDARGTAKWGTIRFTAAAPQGASVTLQTRTGDVAQPDDTWSPWSPSYRLAGGETILSPPGRYIQYQATLTGGASGKEIPALRTVEAFYLTPNQVPLLALTTPQGGEVWKGKQTIRWTASDPDRDTLFYSVSLSGDGGKTWQPVGGMQHSAGPGTSGTAVTAGTAAPQTANPAVPVTVVPVQSRAALTAELDRHPEIPAEMRARILADAPTDGPAAPTVARPSSAAASAAAPTRDTSVPLDTTAFADGTYMVRVIASDKPSNPAGALTAQKMSGEVRIVNRVPTLALFKSALKRGDDGAVTLEGSSLQTGAAIRAVQFRVDGGDWTAAIATDGLFDSTSESFTLTTAPLVKGSTHRLEVQVQDEAGNTTTQTLTV